MITIEGLGGKGTLWCATPFGPYAQTNNYAVDAYVYAKNSFIAAPPSTMLLPPVGPVSIWYPCATSVYGPRLSQYEIGTLNDVTTSPNQPNPCTHSTLKGGLMHCGTDPLSMPHLLRPWTQALDGKTFYTPTGAEAQFMQGMRAQKYPVQASYDRHGALVDLGMDYTYNVVYAMLTDWCQSVGSSNPLFTNGVTQDMWMSSLPDSSRVPASGSIVLTRIECIHVSATVWKETTWYECHQNASYTPASPISDDTGLGFIVALSKHVRTITLTHVQSTATTVFNGRYDCHEVLTYSWLVGSTKPALTEGTSTSDYTFESEILVLAPGLTTAGVLVNTPLDNYCRLAAPRAILLYKSKNATIARSNALADVTGLDSNWIENLSQIKGTVDVIKPLLLGWKAVKTGNLQAGKRALIDAYLTYMYVVAPGIRDFNDIKDNGKNVAQRITINRFSQERRRGIFLTKLPVCDSVADVAYYSELHLKLKDNPVAQLMNALESLGLNPSAANLWDLIPFSFVADWFIPIGSVLRRLDAYENNALLRDVKSRIETFKVLWPLTRHEIESLVGKKFSVTSPIKYVWYDRRILTGIGSYDPFAGQSLDGLTVSQMTQGGALLSSYKRR